MDPNGALGDVDAVVERTPGRELIKARCSGGAMEQAYRIGVEVRAKLADTRRAPWCYVMAKTQVPECQAEGRRKVAD